MNSLGKIETFFFYIDKTRRTMKIGVILFLKAVKIISLLEKSLGSIKSQTHRSPLSYKC